MLVRELFERLQRRLEIGEPTFAEIVGGAAAVSRWAAFVRIRGIAVGIIGTDDVPAERLFVTLIREVVRDQFGACIGSDDPLSDQENYRQALDWLEREVGASGGTSVP
ncbi:MAG: hypothetical protein HY341_02965 [Candidatus Kerfeldbacteria bacterium]|nr:hypothetical protein [Candidatus Kerfeldbacteria bacterium]